MIRWPQTQLWRDSKRKIIMKNCLKISFKTIFLMWCCGPKGNLYQHTAVCWPLDLRFFVICWNWCVVAAIKCQCVSKLMLCVWNCFYDSFMSIDGIDIFFSHSCAERHEVWTFTTACRVFVLWQNKTQRIWARWFLFGCQKIQDSWLEWIIGCTVGV